MIRCFLESGRAPGGDPSSSRSTHQIKSNETPGHLITSQNQIPNPAGDRAGSPYINLPPSSAPPSLPCASRSPFRQSLLLVVGRTTLLSLHSARNKTLQSSHIQLAAAMMSPVPETFAMDQQLVQPVAAAEQEQLCYVHCNYCDTILAVRIVLLVSVGAPAVSNSTAYCSVVHPLMLCRVRMYSFSGGRAVQQPVQNGGRAVRPLRQPALR
jgi:hypothetical protein